MVGAGFRGHVCLDSIVDAARSLPKLETIPNSHEHRLVLTVEAGKLSDRILDAAGRLRAIGYNYG